MKVNVRFTFNRLPLRLMHRALEIGCKMMDENKLVSLNLTIGTHLDPLIDASQNLRYFELDRVQGPDPRNCSALFGPKKPVVKLQFTCFEKLIFCSVFNGRKTKKIAKFDGLELRRCEDMKGIVAPKIGPKCFGTQGFKSFPSPQRTLPISIRYFPILETSPETKVFFRVFYRNVA